MSRCFKDKLPSTANVLRPNVVSDGKSVLQRRQYRQKYFYDRNARDRKPHEIGDSVRVKLNKTWDNSVVTGIASSPRSYIITTEDGGTYRRNQKVLNPSPHQVQIIPTGNDAWESGANTDPSCNPPDQSVASPPRSPQHGPLRELLSAPQSHVDPTLRRSSRPRRKPAWQENYKMNSVNYY